MSKKAIFMLAGGSVLLIGAFLTFLVFFVFKPEIFESKSKVNAKNLESEINLLLGSVLTVANSQSEMSDSNSTTVMNAFFFEVTDEFEYLKLPEFFSENTNLELALNFYLKDHKENYDVSVLNDALLSFGVTEDDVNLDINTNITDSNNDNASINIKLVDGSFFVNLGDLDISDMIPDIEPNKYYLLFNINDVMGTEMVTQTDDVNVSDEDKMKAQELVDEVKRSLDEGVTFVRNMNKLDTPSENYPLATECYRGEFDMNNTFSLLDMYNVSPASLFMMGAGNGLDYSSTINMLKDRLELMSTNSYITLCLDEDNELVATLVEMNSDKESVRFEYYLKDKASEKNVEVPEDYFDYREILMGYMGLLFGMPMEMDDMMY
jgi:hypothetical protein